MALPAADFGSVGSLLMAEGLAVRAQGLSNAYAALADDEASLQTDPAGLARSQGLAIGGGQALGLLGDGISYLHAAWRAGNAFGLGLQAAYAGVDDDTRDPFGNVLGRFSDRELLLGLGLGVTVAPGWRLGLAAKGLQQDLAGSVSLGLAGDLGLQVDLGQGWSAGASVLNAGASSGAASLPTPLRLQAGLAAPFFSPHWMLEADLQGLPLEQQARLLIGSELRFDLAGADSAGAGPDRVALRGGAQLALLKSEESRLSVGAGLGFGPRFQLDYALVTLGSLGLTHRLSLSLRFAPKPLAGPGGAELSAPWGLTVLPQLGGLLISWSHNEQATQGYNLYSDYGVLVERLNDEPLTKTRQRFIQVERSRTYHFYVRAVGLDGKEGPASEVKTVRVK